MEEKWEPTEYESYFVSSMGRVKKNDRILSTFKTKSGHIAVHINRVNKEIHRLVAKAFISNPFNFICVDHIDRNPANNHSNNLRWCTKSQNGMNRGLQRNNTTGYKGVSKLKNGKFQAGIKINGKRISLGCSFTTAEEAFEAYKAACLKYHGSFAYWDGYKSTP